MVYLAVFLIFIAFGMPFFIAWLFQNNIPGIDYNYLNLTDAGTASDFFSGAVTPVLTLAAFLLLLESYKLQKEELKLTREEMKKSAVALDQQRQIMEEEKKLAKKKSDLETFVVLYNNLMKKTTIPVCESIADLYKIGKQTHMRKGSEVNRYSINEYGEYLQKLIFEILDTKPIMDMKLFDADNKTGEQELERIVMNYHTNLFTFFAGIEQLIRFIESTDDKENRKVMFNILKSSFTFAECIVLNLYVSDYILGEILTPYGNRFFIKQYIDKIVPTSFLRL